MRITDDEITELQDKYSDRLPMTDAEEQRHRAIASACTIALFIFAAVIFSVAGWIIGSLAAHFTP